MIASKRIAMWAAHIYERNGVEELNSFDLNDLAKVFAKAEDYKKAIMHQEKAVKLAEAALEKNKTGTVTPTIIDRFKQALVKYKGMQ
uniref:hypothetical protein n=1 Tax=Pedobacter schmidteae TaxID=2201271 RepID=UPI0013CE7C4B|nr:hypothetical protein [Pedobacter schmidteae]